MLIELLLEHIYIASFLGFGSVLAIGAFLDYTENYVFATFLALGVGYALMHVVGPIDSATAIWLAVAYVAAGSIWMVVRWYFFVKKERNKIVRAKNEYCDDHGLDRKFFREFPVSDDAKKHHQSLVKRLESNSNWSAQKADTLHDYIKKVKPQVSGHRGRVIAWGVYWPASVLIFILADFGVMVSGYVYDLTSGVLQKISDSVFSENV